jgi:hypothetical protein
MQLDCVDVIAAVYLEEVMRYLGLDELSRGWTHFGELGTACPMPAALREQHTYRRFFELHPCAALEVCAHAQLLRTRPLPWAVRYTRVETPETAALRLASAEVLYEAQLVAYLATQRGFCNLSSGVHAHCPPPLDLADAGIGLGAFLNARPHLFCRSRCGNSVKSVPLARVRAPRPALLPPPPPPPPPPVPAPVQQPRAPAAPPASPPAATPPVDDDEPPPEHCCVVCLHAQKEGAFLPCMHKCCCMPCGDRIMLASALCPMCRGACDRFARVYE